MNRLYLAAAVLGTILWAQDPPTQETHHAWVNKASDEPPYLHSSDNPKDYKGNIIVRRGDKVEWKCGNCYELTITFTGNNPCSDFNPSNSKEKITCTIVPANTTLPATSKKSKSAPECSQPLHYCYAYRITAENGPVEDPEVIVDDSPGKENYGVVKKSVGNK